LKQASQQEQHFFATTTAEKTETIVDDCFHEQQDAHHEIEWTHETDQTSTKAERTVMSDRRNVAIKEQATTAAQYRAFLSRIVMRCEIPSPSSICNDKLRLNCAKFIQPHPHEKIKADEDDVVWLKVEVVEDVRVCLHRAEKICKTNKHDRPQNHSAR
jgi:hypothetical protein